MTVETPFAENLFQLVEVSGKEAISKPCEFNLLMLCNYADIDILGKEIQFTIQDQYKNVRYFYGIVQTCEITPHENKNCYLYRVTIASWLNLLKTIEHSKIFHQKNALDIFLWYCHQLNIKHIDIKQLNNNFTNLNYTVQYQESIYNFLHRILAESNIHYYFDNDAITTTMKLVQHLPIDKIKNQINVCIKKENYFITPTRYIIRNYNYFNPSAKTILTLDATKKLIPKLCHSQYMQTTFSYHQLEKKLKQTVGEMIHNKSQIYIDSDANNFYLGYKINYDNKNLIIKEILYHAKDDSFATLPQKEIANAQHYRCQYICKDIAMPIYPKVTPYPLPVSTMQTAEIFMEQGMKPKIYSYIAMKIKYHWQQQASQQELLKSIPVRLSQLLAQQNYGSQYAFNAEQQILVQFYAGDPQYAVILGWLPDRKYPPIYSLPEQKFYSGIKCMAANNLHNEILFIDELNKESMMINAAKDLQIYCDKNLTENITGHYAMQIAGDLTITANHFSLQSQKKITLQGGGTKICIDSESIQVK